MKIKTEKNMEKKGFTLMELLIVIAIIGILSGIVLVNTRSGIDKAKKASALTTASSALPEIVTCQDDGGTVNAYNTASNICTAAGHSTKWPDLTSSGYTTVTFGGTNLNDTFVYNVSNGTITLKCVLASNNCCEVGTPGC